MVIANLGQLNSREIIAGTSRTIDCFQKLQKLGEGTYAKVFKAREKQNGEIVALKKLRMEGEDEGFPITALREIKILNKLHHENIIKLKEVVVSPADNDNKKDAVYLVFEYMDHDLTGLACRVKNFSAAQIKCYMKQLLTGLHYCHVNQVLHRDIKGANLLLDNNGTLKLADFGLARVVNNNDKGKLTNLAVTLWYRPPELLLGSEDYGPAVDMWSVGCVFAEILDGNILFRGKNEVKQLYKIFELCGFPDESSWPGFSELPYYDRLKQKLPVKRCLQQHFRQKNLDLHALELLEKMLILDPAQRISTIDALDSDYFWTDPMPCDPKSLPKYESTHDLVRRNIKCSSRKRKKQNDR